MFRRLAFDVFLPLALGVIATFGFAPFGWYGLTLCALAALFGLWWYATPGWAAWHGGLFGFAHSLASFYWLCSSAHAYTDVPQAVGLVSSVLPGFVLTVLVAATGAFASFTRSLPRVIWAFVLVPGAWVLAELLRGVLSSGFPGLAIGYSLTGAPLTPLFPLVGIYGLSFGLVAAAGGLLLLVIGGLIDRLSVVIVASALPLVLWFLPPAVSWTQASAAAIDVAALQQQLTQIETDYKTLNIAGVDVGLMPACMQVRTGKLLQSLPGAQLLARPAPNGAHSSAQVTEAGLACLRMRALEAGRPLLRFNNAGTATIIEADGQVRAWPQPLNSPASKDTVQPRRGITPYLRYGDKPMWVFCLAVVLMGILVPGRRQQ